MLDREAPADAVIASSTSAILPSKFTEGLKGRHRCLVIHPINPPYLIPAAEVVPARRGVVPGWYLFWTLLPASVAMSRALCRCPGVDWLRRQ